MTQKYLKYRPPSDKQFLIHGNSDPLTIYQFHPVLKRCLKFLKIGHLPISSHLFHIGAATEAANLGFSESVIKNIGGWKSKCYSSYVRPNVCLWISDSLYVVWIIGHSYVFWAHRRAEF